MTFREKIENTAYFKGLGKMLQSITSKHHSVKEIEHNYTVAKNIGFAKWNAQQSCSSIQFNIVRELIDNDRA